MKKLGDVLELIPDYMNVSVVDKLHVEIARYDGKDSIPESMNEYEVYYKNRCDNSVGIMIVVVLSAACAFLSVVVDLEMPNDTKDKSLISADDARKKLHGNKKRIAKELKKINKDILYCVAQGRTSYTNYGFLCAEIIDELEKKGYQVQWAAGGYVISWKE